MLGNINVPSNFDVSTIKKWAKEHLENVKGIEDLVKDINITYDEQGVYCFSLYGQQYGTLLRFYFKAYPSCCAMMQFYNFSYSHTLPEEVIESFLDLVFKGSNRFGTYFASKRFVVAMVEQRSLMSNNPHYHQSDKWHEWERDFQKECVVKEFEEIEKPVMFFPAFRNWFKKQKKCKTTSIMYNTNTKNLIHLLEVVV